MRLFRITFFIISIFPIFCFAFTLPPSAKIISDSKGENTWKQNAEFDMAFTATENLLEARMLSCGFSKKHTQRKSDKNSISISLWESSKNKIIVMIWKISDSKTGVSWGYEK